MKSISSLFYLGFFLLLVNSCTITKRHFGNGYHVEWKKHWDKTDESAASDELEKTDTLYAQGTISEMIREESLSVNEIESVIENKVPAKTTVSGTEEQTQNESGDKLISKEELIREEVNTISQSTDYPDDYETKKRVEPLTWVAFSLFLLALAMFLIPLSFAAANASVLGLIFSLLILIAAVTALISWLHIKKDPSAYKGKTFTGIVLFFCSAGVGLAILTIIHFLIDSL